MRTRGRRVRSTKVVGIGRQRADYLARRLATALKERRRAEHLSQRKLAELVGVSQPEIHRLEAGRGANAGLDTWAAIAAALGMQLAASIEQVPGASQPHDMEHLKRQDLVIRTANAGAWRAQPEAMLVDDGRYARSIDVLLTRSARREAAVVEVWDLITDGGAAMRGLEAKVRSTRERVGPGWRVQGLLVVRGTQRNRGLVASVRAVFATRFPRIVRRLAASASGSDDRDAGRPWLRVDRRRRNEADRRSAEGVSQRRGLAGATSKKKYPY